MAADELFESSTRSSGDLTGVFEHDGDVGYFYLYETAGGEGRKVIDAIRVLSGDSDFGQEDIAVRWDGTETRVALFIRNQAWAVFDTRTGAKYGGAYRVGSKIELPPEITDSFA